MPINIVILWRSASFFPAAAGGGECSLEVFNTRLSEYGGAGSANVSAGLKARLNAPGGAGMLRQQHTGAKSREGFWGRLSPQYVYFGAPGIESRGLLKTPLPPGKPERRMCKLLYEKRYSFLLQKRDLISLDSKSELEVRCYALIPTI